MLVSASSYREMVVCYPTTPEELAMLSYWSCPFAVGSHFSYVHELLNKLSSRLEMLFDNGCWNSLQWSCLIPYYSLFFAAVLKYQRVKLVTFMASVIIQ